MLSVSLGAVLAFIGVLVFLYGLSLLGRTRERLLFIFGLGILLIGLGLMLGVEITLCIKPDMMIAAIITIIGGILMGIGFYER